MQIALFEGVSGAGKTTLLQHIKKKIIEQNHSKFTQLFFSEHMTERVFEPAFHDGVLHSDHVKAHLMGIISHLEDLSKAYTLSPFARSPKPVCQAFIERFGISHCLKQYLTEDDLNTVFQKFSCLHSPVILFHLQLKEEQIFNNIQRSLTHRDQAWADYVETQGGVERIADKLWAEQKQATSLIETLSPYIYVKYLDMSSSDYASLAEHILKEMGEGHPQEKNALPEERNVKG